MGTNTPPVDRPQHEIGPLGWFAMAGFISMGALYFLDVVTEGGAISPMISLPIGIVAGVGVLLVWSWGEPIIEYTE